MTELEKQLLDVARSILADDMLQLLPAEYVAKVRSAIAAAEAAPPATVKDSLIVQQAPAARLSYFAYDPDVGFEQFNTEAEAIVFAQAAIDAYREVAGDGWDEDVESVCWGVVHGTTQQVAVDEDYDGRHGLGEVMFVDYILTGPAPAQVEQQVPAPLATARAIEAAAAAIYLADSSDYLGAMWTVLRWLSPDIAALMEKDERAAWGLACTRLTAEANQERTPDANH